MKVTELVVIVNLEPGPTQTLTKTSLLLAHLLQVEVEASISTLLTEEKA
jgi:hypothetical protein